MDYSITDTHCHLYASELSQTLDKDIQAALAAGVDRIFLPNIDLDSLQPMLNLVKRFPKNVFPAFGLHPCYVKADYEQALATIFAKAQQQPYYAVGEIGIDLYWDKTTFSIQEKAFRWQIEYAMAENKPIMIHSREATDIIIGIVKDYPKLRGVFHCFTGTAQQAQQIVDMGFYLGIGGVLTYKNANLSQEIANIPLTSILLETDAPYLSPVPHRGKPNKPEYIVYVAQRLCDVYNLSLSEIATVTTQNSKDLFGV